MLSKLEIHNYILIDKLSIDLSNQLSVLTGETGAGKSIIMGALGLILGDRADSSVCRDATKKCFIEGTFLLKNKNTYQTYFTNHELDFSDEVIIRREINAQGKSRAFINDSPISLNDLKQLTSQLVDLHQQFDTLSLGDTDFQRTVIDALAGVQVELNQYQSLFQLWKDHQKHVSVLIAQRDEFEKTESFKKHLLEEIAAMQLKENELENLEQELKFLENAVSIKAQIDQSIQILDSAENPIVQQLKQITNNLDSIVKWQPEFADLLNRLKATQIELADVANELIIWQDKIDFDDKKMVFIQDRLSEGYHLQKKHKVQSTHELINIQNQLELDLTAVLSLDEEINQLSNQVKLDEKQVAELANTLTQKRSKEMAPFTKNVNQLLHQVGMPNAKIKVSLEEVAFNTWGKDKIDFLFDANNTQKFETIKKVASGGELSRLMLCIKSLVAKSIDLPTMIFDEIDTGISGEPAKQVGLLLQGLGQTRQVLCITHQPQIAAKGHTHLLVYKEQKQATTNTFLRTLNPTERIQHIAQMIGGTPPSKSALENAKELLASK